VICELLGVPYADRAYFRGLSVAMSDLQDFARSAAAHRELVGYIMKLVGHKRSEPGNDLLTELTEIEDGGLTDLEIAELGAAVLFAGHETTVVRISVGTVLLLANPDQLELLLADPARVPAAVEEIVRLATAGDTPGLPRYARTDIDFGGVHIAAGDLLLLSIGAANRDEATFPDSERLDLGRDHLNSHVGFGFGARYCIGAVLARMELTAVFERLFQRIPTLRLAVPARELRWRRDMLTGGYQEVPVTW
jgi:pentalenolactone synthase